MASALVGGLLKNGFAAEQIGVVEVDPAARDRLRAECGVHVTADLGEGVKSATLIVLAVKPQQLREVAQQLRPVLSGQLLVTIAAGIRTQDLSRWLGGYSRVVRVMPNTPALVRAGVSALYAMPEVSVEEFIEGSEFTYDAVTIDGKPVFESVTQYHPPPLQGRTLEWISPAQITLRDPYIPATQCGVALGRQVLEALHMGTGFAHMEWFKNRRGEAVFSEIACRSGGGKLMDALNFANDIDIYREWARAVCWHAFDAVPQRKYHVVSVFKRALGQGRITRIEGLDVVRRRCGSGLVVTDLLPVGHPRRNWKQTLLGDGYVTMRSVDYRDACEMRDVAVNALRLYAE